VIKRAVPINKVKAVSAPDIYSFDDYREYLKVHYDYLKKKNPRFSYRYFSKIAGLGGQSYLRMIMTGQRNLSQKSVAGFAKAFKFGRNEARFFEALVYYTQAASEEERSRYAEILSGLKPKTRVRGIAKDQYEYFTDNIHVVIRELAALPDFQEDVRWISKVLRTHPMSTQVSASLKVLERLGLLVRDQKGRLRHSGKTLKNPPEIPSSEVLNYHRRILTHARDLIMTSPKGEWDLLSITLPMRKQSLSTIMQILKKAVLEIMDHINQGSKQYDEVYQLNMQLFPMTQVVKTGKTTL